MGNHKEYYDKSIELAEQTVIEQKKEKADYYKAVKSFEQDRIDSLVNQRKFLIRGVAGCGVVVLIMAGALMALAPLKTAVPYVIRVDSATGYTDIAKTVEDSKSSYDEVINKYWIAQYVINYESYDWQTIQTMYDTVALMSANGPFSAYKASMLAEGSPLNVLKNSYKLRTKIKTIVFLKPDVAQVRFSKIVLSNDGKKASDYVTTDWVAVINFDFAHKIKTEGERLLNPLGFNVLSYRVDPEVVK
ncbi:MAG: virB8 family protein [Aeromonas sp.]